MREPEEIIKAREIISRLLTRKVGVLLKAVTAQINALSLAQLESLTEAFFDFQTLTDLEDWLAQNRRRS